MFDWVEKHKRWIQFALLILIVPSFAFFGINYYFNEYGDSGAVATVAGTRISQQEFESALRERQDQLRQMMKEKVDPALLDGAEVRNAVVNGLVEKRALLAHALHAGMAVPDAQVQKVVAEVPYFKDESGKFSLQRYEQVLKSQGMTPVMFEERVRQDLRLSQTRDAAVGSTLLSDAVVTRIGAIREQRREVSQWVLSPEQFLAGVNATDAEVKKRYDDGQSDFRVPERVRVEYITFTPEAAGKTVKVTPEEIEAEYRKNQAQYATAEQRRASHILLTVPKDATPAVRDEVRKKAEQVLAQVRANPRSFADLARKNPQDPGSAVKGGDLGLFGRGTMVKAFDEAVFSMKPGDLAGPVETNFGYHVIRLDEIKPGSATPLDKVRGDIEAELRKPRLAKAFAEAAESFQEMVYAQADSLKPAAEAYKLEIRTSDWITRGSAGSGDLTKPELLAKIFSDDAIRQKRNTEAVEVAPNTLVAARVLEHRPASVLPFDDVKDDIRQQVLLEKAAAAALAEGKSAVERLSKGEAVAKAAWAAPAMLTLQAPGDMPPEAVRGVFSAPASKLPAYVGAQATKGRYVVYRISRVEDGAALSAEQKTELRKQLQQLAAQQQFDAYMQVVKAAADVSVETARLEKKAQ